MQRFFLHLKYLDRMVIDLEGSSLKSLDQAIEEAREDIRDIAAISIRTNKVLDLWSIQVADADGTLLAEVLVSDTLRPVVPALFLDAPPLVGPA